MAGFRSPGFPLGLSAKPIVPVYGYRSVLPFFSASRGVIPPVPVFRRGGHNDDDEIMAIVMAFVGVMANGRT